MAKKEYTPIAKPSQQDIDGWKKDHEEVHKLKVGDKVAYLHNPDILTVSLAMSRMASKDVIGSAKAILDNCWLGGDEEIKTKPKYLVNALEQVNSIIEPIESSMEKL